jgi:hypothetical protein
LLVAILFVAIFVMAVRPTADTDTWWHLKSGQLMWERGELLRSDPFSHTVAGEPWINHGWLVQVLIWPVYEVLGLGGLALLLAAAVTLAFALVYLQCEGRPFLAVFAVLLAAVASSVYWSLRPQMMSFLLTALSAYLMHRYAKTDSAWWLVPLPFLVALWVNCHGGFVIAFILMGCYLVGLTLNRLTAYKVPQARLAPLVLFLLLSIPAVLLNPYTIRMYAYAIQTVSVGPLQDFIQEWSVPDFHSLQFQPFVWLLLLTMVAMGLSRKRASWTELMLVSVFAYMSLLASRNIALFALVTPPVLTRHAVTTLDDLALVPRLSWLGALTHSLPPRRPTLSLALFNVLLLLLVTAGAGAKVGTEFERLQDPEIWGRGLPLETVEYLRDHRLPGYMFNTYNWGGYLIWSLYPEKPVFVDGRTDLYAFESQVLEDYTTVHWVRPEWPEILDAYKIGFIVTERTGLLDLFLAERNDWREVHRDNVAAVYVRSEAVR